MTATNNVPCRGCTACCYEPPHLEEWEDPAAFGPGLSRVWNRAKRDWTFQLPAAPDGSCIHREDSGCAIHERAPHVCREFDCRAWFRAYSRAQRRALARTGEVPQAVWDAAKERLDNEES